MRYTSIIATFFQCIFRNEPSAVTLALIHKDVRQKGIPSASCYFPVKSTLSAQKGSLARLQEVPGESRVATDAVVPQFRVVL